MILVLLIGALIFIVAFGVTSWLQGSADRDRFDKGPGRDRPEIQPVSHQLPSGHSLGHHPAEALTDIEDELRSLLANGQKIEALKRIRYTTGWGLKAAKTYLEQLQVGNPSGGDPAAVLADMEGELRSLLAQNKKIQALKQVRNATGWGLREAKDYIEQLEMNS